MIASLLILALSSSAQARAGAKTAATAKPSVEERAKDTAVHLLKRVPKIAWKTDRPWYGDVNGDRIPDVVLLGTAPDQVSVGIVFGPVSAGSKPAVLRFGRPKGQHPDPGALCGEPSEITLGFEPPGVKPSDLACAGKAIDEDCKELLATELRLQKARARGAVGIRLSGGKCLPLHIYCDRGGFHWWRHE